MDAFLIRDLDSRISPREHAAVSAFLGNRKKKFLHVMRDHPAHQSSMLAGMWGAMLDSRETRRKFLVSFKSMLKVRVVRLCW